jgi:hypothetical protein
MDAELSSLDDFPFLTKMALWSKIFFAENEVSGQVWTAAQVFADLADGSLQLGVQLLHAARSGIGMLVREYNDSRRNRANRFCVCEALRN